MRAEAAALAVACVLLGGCTTGPVPTPSGSASASASPAARPFTVTTTEMPHSLDPAAATSGADALAALNLFQRLLRVSSTTGGPVPDAADCLFTAPTVYECTLVKDLAFNNGNALTASDVKFSIERAYRLNVSGTSIRLFDALQKVDAVDDRTVRFTLAWPDGQFGDALATPVASIVDEQTYDPDALRAATAPAVGSGPFVLQEADVAGWTLTRNPTYTGPTEAGLPLVRVAFVVDSAAAEQAMTAGGTDVVWGSLDDAALGRLASGSVSSTLTRVDLPNSRVRRLVWNPTGPSRSRADVRTAVAGALQADRTLAALVPAGVEGSTASFAVGGNPTPAPITGARVRLTLSYASRAPGEADLARLLRDRLEANAGLSVQLTPDTAAADLQLTDVGAAVNTALGWLQPYLDSPLPGSQAKLTELSRTARTMTVATARVAVLAEIQQQAAADATVLPISSGQQTLFVRQGYKITGDTFGPCWQLGLWGFTR